MGAFDAVAVPGGGSLFERLSRSEHSGGVDNVVDSIKRHLVRLLNAHPGNSESAPGLGLMDFNDATLGTHDLNVRIRQAIRHCIETYEPRVRRVEVMSLPKDHDPLQLRFQVTVHIAVSSRDEQATIDLLLDDRHYYRVL